jgi:hypothetical protein
MTRLVIRSWLLLVHADLVMQMGGLSALHRVVRGEAVCSISESPVITDERICRAIDLACVLYFKRVMCLQRSAATAILLRRFGHRAQLVIGAQLIPFRAHAWVENKGRIVNDKPYMLEIYQVLDRC